jgi:Protein of unknown function (DUF2934)
MEIIMKTSRHGGAASARGRFTTSPVNISPTHVAPLHEAIERRAFVKWKARGCPSSTALQDWLEAEAELKFEIGQRRRG